MSPLVFPLGWIGPSELWPILAILILLFGAAKLPVLARSMGSSINQFKKGLKDEKGARLEDKDAEGPEKAPE